jgi:hypothetical protein
VPKSIFFMMALGAWLGYAIGALYNGIILGQSVPWITLATTLLMESWMAARYGRRANNRPLTNDQRVRLALWYSFGVGAINSLIIAPMLFTPGMAMLNERMAGLTRGSIAIALLIVAAGLGALSLLRFLLLSLFNPKR